MYDHLDVWTGYVSIDYILKMGGVPDSTKATAAQRQRAQAFQQQAMAFERANWQSGLKSSWEDGIKGFTTSVHAIDPGEYDKVKEQVQKQLNALGTTVAAEWQKMEQKDSNLRQNNNKGPLRPDLGQRMWKRIVTDIGLNAATTQPATQPSTQPTR